MDADAVRKAVERLDTRVELTPPEWRGPLVDVIDTIDNVKVGLASLGIDDNFLLIEATRLVLERYDKQQAEGRE